MSNRSHINTGIRKVLELPSVYNTFQTIIGGNKHRKDHFRKNFLLTDNDHVLDIGCGTGVFLDYCSNNNINYIGCDMEESYIKHAKTKYPQHEFLCERVGEILRKEWENKFNYINAHGLLHHLSDADSEELLKICHFYLKEGGSMITVDTVFHDKQSSISKWISSKDRGQNIRYPKEYIALASKYFSKCEGFVDDKSLKIPYSIYTMKLTK